MTRPLCRAPGATEWQAISWGEVITKIARRFEARDPQGRTVNRLANVAMIAGFGRQVVKAV